MCRSALVSVMMFAAGPLAAQTDAVEQLVTDGIELRVQGRELEALERFRKAVALAPSSLRAQGHLALSLHARGHWVESERVMQQVLNAAADEWVTRHISELRESLQAVQGHLAWLEVDAPGPGEIWIDGTFVGTLPIRGPVRVAAQHCSLEFRYPGRASTRRTIDIPAGQYLRLTLVEPAPEQAPERNARERSVAKRAEPEPVASPAAPIRNSKSSSIGMLLLGIGTAGLVAGASFGINAILLRRERDKECDPVLGCTVDGIALDARGRQSAQLADISLVIGVAGMGIGAVMVW